MAMPPLPYAVRRSLLVVPTLLAISAILFLVINLAPGDPLGSLATSPSITPEIQANLRRVLGLDQPLPIRYGKWLWAFLHGNMGYSFLSPLPVRDLIAQRLPVTLGLMGLAYGLGVCMAFPLGILAAVYHRRSFDQAIRTIALTGFSIPPFFLGILLILLFSVHWGWLPFIYDSTLVVKDWTSFLAQGQQSLMPLTVLTLYHTALLVRYVRSSLLDHLSQDYIRTAYAKGLPKVWVILRHGLRNALIPLVTLIALDLPSIFTGALVTEQIFRVPGMGSLLIDAINQNDTPVVLAITLIYALLTVVLNLVADLTYGWLDPRVRLG